MGTFIFNTIAVFASFLACIFFGGLLLEKIEERTSSNVLGCFGYKGLMFTCIGTIVHELAHLLFVLVFKMKPTDVKLLRPVKAKYDGVLGYVKYSYNRKSWFHKVGLFFVGAAPVIIGVATVFVSLKLFMPTVYDATVLEMKSIGSVSGMISFEYIMVGLNVIKVFFFELIVASGSGGLSYWIGLYIIMSVAMHMSLSKADVNGMVSGLPGIYVIIFLVMLLLSAIGFDYSQMFGLIGLLNMYVFAYIFTAIIFAIMALGISYCMKIICDWFR